jgi:hypothetical protein
MQDEKQAIELVKWGVDNYNYNSFFSFYHHFGSRLFEENGPDNKKLWIDWLWDKGFLNSRNFHLCSVFERYDTLKEAIDKSSIYLQRQFNLFNYLIQKKYRFPANILDEVIGHHDEKSAELFFQNGYVIKEQRLVWLDVTKSDRNLTHNYFTYVEEEKTTLSLEEFKELKLKHSSYALEILVLPSLKWLYNHFPFTDEEFENMADCFFKSSFHHVLYQWLYDNNENVRFYNDNNNNSFYERRTARRGVKINLPDLRKNFKEKNDKLNVLRTEETKLSNYIKSFGGRDTDKVWHLSLPIIPELPQQIGNLDEWETVSRDKKFKSKKNQQELKESLRENLQTEYDKKLQERQMIVEKYNQYSLRNANINNINDTVKLFGCPIFVKFEEKFAKLSRIFMT